MTLPNNKTYYCIFWKNKITSEIGNGRATTDKNSLEVWIKEMNKKYPDIDHYIRQISLKS